MDVLARIRDNLISMPRDYCLFIMAINTPFKAQDLLLIKARDVRKRSGEIRDLITIREESTGELRSLRANQSVKEAVLHYLGSEKFDDNDLLFYGSLKTRAINRSYFYKLIQKWLSQAGVTEGNYGNISLRKTWGYWAILKGENFGKIMDTLGQKSIQDTFDFLGIDENFVPGWQVDLDLPIREDLHFKNQHGFEIVIEAKKLPFVGEET